MRFRKKDDDYGLVAANTDGLWKRHVTGPIPTAIAGLVLVIGLVIKLATHASATGVGMLVLLTGLQLLLLTDLATASLRSPKPHRGEPHFAYIVSYRVLTGIGLLFFIGGVFEGFFKGHSSPGVGFMVIAIPVTYWGMHGRLTMIATTPNPPVITSAHQQVITGTAVPGATGNGYGSMGGYGPTGGYGPADPMGPGAGGYDPSAQGPYPPGTPGYGPGAAGSYPPGAPGGFMPPGSAPDAGVYAPQPEPQGRRRRLFGR